MAAITVEATPGEHAQVKAQAAKERTTITRLCLGEILRRVERGYDSLKLERKLAVLEKEIAELRERQCADVSTINRLAGLALDESLSGNERDYAQEQLDRTAPLLGLDGE